MGLSCRRLTYGNHKQERLDHVKPFIKPLIRVLFTGNLGHNPIPPRGVIMDSMAQKPLEPLIPLDELKRVLAKIVAA